MSLPIESPFAPMDALLTDEIPRGEEWEYEPKWDGFRCLVFREGNKLQLQSKSGQPLTRYFPELSFEFLRFDADRFVLDGEIAIPVGTHFSFDDLLQRIHPAASRVQKLSHEHPAVFIAFDLLVAPGGESLLDKPLQERRRRLEQFASKHFGGSERFRLSPATTDLQTAHKWFDTIGSDLDGIIGKRLDLPYQPGLRTGMVKVKHMRTADCVIGGFRYAAKQKVIGSLLLGLYDEARLLNHVGFCSGLANVERKALRAKLEPLIESPGFTGHAPGGLSRWSTKRSMEWQPLRPELVVEVSYDHFTGGRFRHGTKLIRWRPDKSPEQCRMDQVAPSGKGAWALVSNV